MYSLTLSSSDPPLRFSGLHILIVSVSSNWSSKSEIDWLPEKQLRLTYSLHDVPTMCNFIEHVSLCLFNKKEKYQTIRTIMYQDGYPIVVF